MRILKSIVLMLCTVQFLHAQFYYFGHNKVQYTEFDWHILRTQHFDIYYYPEMKELAERGAFFAEEAFKNLENKFNHTLLNRVPLIFYSSHLHFQQTNTTPGFIPEGVGGFFEFLKGRVVIPADGSLARFRHVIRHEMTHVFMHSKLNRVLVDHRVPADRMPPLWFTEGLAELWSTVPDDQAEMVMRDAVLNNYIAPLADIEQIYGTFLMYKEGQNILSFIEQQYGEEKILLLMENFWKSTSFNDIMRTTIGKNYKEFDETWLYYLKKKYYPVLSSSEYTSHVAKVLMKTGFNSKPVFFNNNGQQEVYYIGNYTGYTSIYKMNVNPKPDEEKNTKYISEPQLVVSGEKTDEFETFHLFQSKLDISKDGILAFTTKSGETDALHLFDVKKNELVRTLQFPSLVIIASPCWSPDGTRIVFSSIDKSGTMDLYLYNFSNEQLTRLTNDMYDDRDPSWSPDGTMIVFSSDRNPNGMDQVYNIESYNVASQKIFPVTRGKENYYSPSFSPDGKYLTFTSNYDGAQNVWAMCTEEMKTMSALPPMKKVTDFSNAVFDPYWTDNNELLFTGFENYSFRIYLLDKVSLRIDSSKTEHRFTVPSVPEPWHAHSTEGDTTVQLLHYKGDYTLDIAQSAVATDPVFGTSAGAALAMSDVLGNDQYYFLLYNNAESSDEFLEGFNLAVSRISLSQRTNYATGIFHFSGRRYDLTDPDLYYYERSFGGYLAASYPLSKFRRVEAGVSLSNSDKEVIYGFRPRKALILSNSVSFVHDNSLWGPTGPLDGSRFIATLAYTSDVQYSNVQYYTIIGDYRWYYRIDTRVAFASRFQLLMNEGKESRRFVMGGSWDLRGFDRWSLRGKKAWLTSYELRFPFIDQLAIRFPFGSFGLGSFRGALFADAGSVWDNKYRETLGSFGTGVRWNIGGVLVLRYDVGKTIRGDWNEFQPGLFYQFFFGWDF